MTDDHPAPDLDEAFAAFDRARLAASDESVRTAQLAARQLLYDYVDNLWRDIERSGERPATGEKYRAVAVMRELTRALRTVAFEAVYDAQAEVDPPPTPTV
ncbi:hypothetical protein [Pseudonocardia sp. H11422]|uniref:hypothetical protein n=1 Tax=Pseudonocardia sp. H11422 TaxID=2835866 RepID=UPI001BDD823E|nr:hypothetical protein [Pseudonocardia sp. H11422]